MKKKLSGLTLCGFFLVMAFLAYKITMPKVIPPPTAYTPPQEQRDKKTLYFTTENYPPMQYQEDGKVKGISIDIIKEAFRRMGYNLSIKIYPWSRALEMTKRGEADATFLAYKTPDRENYLIFPKEPVFLDSQSLFAKATTNIQYDGTLTSLQKYKIGIIKDYDFGPSFVAAMNNNSLQTEAIFNNVENIDKLLNNRIDLLLDSSYVIQYYLKQRGLTDKIQMLQPPIRQAYMYLAFSKKRNINKELISEFDQTLRDMKNDGTYEQIMNKYLQDLKIDK